MSSTIQVHGPPANLVNAFSSSVKHQLPNWPSQWDDLTMQPHWCNLTLGLYHRYHLTVVIAQAMPTVALPMRLPVINQNQFPSKQISCTYPLCNAKIWIRGASPETSAKFGISFEPSKYFQFFSVYFAKQKNLNSRFSNSNVLLSIWTFQSEFSTFTNKESTKMFKSSHWNLQIWVVSSMTYSSVRPNLLLAERFTGHFTLWNSQSPKSAAIWSFRFERFRMWDLEIGDQVLAF